jgi:hypothetical protein
MAHRIVNHPPKPCGSRFVRRETSFDSSSPSTTYANFVLVILPIYPPILVIDTKSLKIIKTYKHKGTIYYGSQMGCRLTFPRGPGSLLSPPQNRTLRDCFR